MADHQRDALMRHQVRFLERIQATGVFTDRSLAMAFVEAGIPCDHSTIVNWRAGRRQAPLGALTLMLHHAGEDAGVVLGLLAADHGLRIIADTDGATAGTVTSLMLRAIGEAGRLSSVVSEALADGEVTEDERRAVEAQLEAAAQTIASLRAQLAAPRPRIAR